MQVLQHDSVRARRIILVVDEVHTVSQWMTFRKDMAKLGLFRQRLPPSAVVVGMSATITAKTKTAIVETGLFRPDLTFVTVSTNRPEIFIEFRPLLDTKQRWLDLSFLFPMTMEDHLDLPKTIVFFNSRCDIRNFRKVALHWLSAAGLEMAVATQTVKAYYAPMPQDEKEALLLRFTGARSPVRIMLATDAMGMGIELSSIAVVVQYGDENILKEPSGVSTIVQRMGRAARMSGEQGHFVWLVPKWVFEQQGTHTASTLGHSRTFGPGGSVVETTSKQLKWRNLDNIYRRLFTQCPRAVLLSFFHDGHGTKSEIVRRFMSQPGRCCYQCHPDDGFTLPGTSTVKQRQDAYLKASESMGVPAALGKHDILRLPASLTLNGVGPYYRPAVETLREWRQQVTNDLLQAAGCGLIDVTNILSDANVDRIARMASFFMRPSGDERHFRHFLQDWEHVDVYGRDICRLMNRLVPGTNHSTSGRAAFIRVDRIEQTNRRISESEAYQRRRVATYGPSALNIQTGFTAHGKSTIRASKSKAPARGGASEREGIIESSQSDSLRVVDDTMGFTGEILSQPGGPSFSPPNDVRTPSMSSQASPGSAIKSISQQEMPSTPSGQSISLSQRRRHRSNISPTIRRQSTGDDVESDISLSPDEYTTRSGRTSKPTPKASGHRGYLQ